MENTNKIKKQILIMILALIFNDSIILLYKKDTNLFIRLAQQND